MAQDEKSPSLPAGRGRPEDENDPAPVAARPDGSAPSAGDAPPRPRRYRRRQTDLEVPKPAYVIYEEKLARRKARAQASGETHDESEGISFIPEAPRKPTPRSTVIRRWIYVILSILLFFGLHMLTRQQ